MRKKIKRYVSILCLLSLFVGLINPMNKVEAATEEFYFYDKYVILNMYSDEAPWELVEAGKYLGSTGWFYESYNEKGGWISKAPRAFQGGYLRYVLSINENKYNTAGEVTCDNVTRHSPDYKYKYEYNVNVGSIFFRKETYDNLIYKYQVTNIENGWRGWGYYAPNGEEFGVDGRHYFGNVYKKDPSKNYKKDYKILIQANIKASDGTYPDDGPHSDGYWYMKRGKVNDEIINQEVDIDNLSLELKKDIMPVLNVVVNKNFDEVVQGRGYIANLTKFSDSKGNFTIYRQNSDYIRINGIFYTKGIYYIPVTDSNGKQVHFLFNVIDDPVPASAKKITFK